VFQNPDLTTETRVSSQGTVHMPLIGSVQLQGLTPEEASNLIAQRFVENNILKDPEIVVSLLQVRSRMVSVLGQVARPGRYPLEETNNQLIEVLALAGGTTSTGDDTITVISHRDGKPVKTSVNIASLLAGTDPAANIALENGDTIFVQRAPVFYIYGEVQRPGSYRLEDNLTVMQAMSLGGGITRRGTERGIRIHRPSTDGMLVKLEAKPYDRVQADDVIYVNESLF
jgi:polysaccharide export outer membrane protein